jgi:hypothetical protein
MAYSTEQMFADSSCPVSLAEQAEELLSKLGVEDPTCWTSHERSTVLDTLARCGNRLEGIRARVLAAFAANEDYAPDGNLTANAALRKRYRYDEQQASSLVSLARRLADLPLVAASLTSGDINLDEVLSMFCIWYVF